jgi:hypothetical protein
MNSTHIIRAPFQNETYANLKSTNFLREAITSLCLANI